MLVFVPTLGSLLVWPVCRLAEVPVKKVKLFVGPSLAAFQVLGSNVEIGCIPAGGFVEFDMPVFERKPPLLRLALLLLWPVVLLVGAVLLLGHGPAMHHFATGFSQLFDGVLHPLSTAPALIERLKPVYEESASTAAGVLFAKGACYLAFPGLSVLPIQCLRFLMGPLQEGTIMEKAHVLNGITSVLSAIVWMVAVLSYAWRGA